MVADFRAGGTGYGDIKKRLFEAIWEYFAPMRERREQLLADPGYLEQVMRDGADRARAVAIETMGRVRNAVGLR